MSVVQTAPIEVPLLTSPAATSLALRLVARAQIMGLLPEREGHRWALDREFLAQLAERLQSERIATLASSNLARAAGAEPADDAELTDALRATLEALEASPHPEGEWGAARELLGDDLLARLLGTSHSSLRRYAAGTRRTPDDIAWRLHLIARVLAALVGSYNDYGIRRWFERRRSALGDVSPAEVIERAKSEEDERLQQVVLIADELMGAASAA